MSAKIIEIEGVDKSGKETQSKLLTKKLYDMGYKVLRFSFPNYNSDSSHFVKKYLNGEYGDVNTFNAYQASMFYALDRMITFKTEIEPVINNFDYIILDRYILSNLIHQGAKYITHVKKDNYINDGYLINPNYFTFIDNWYNFELIKLGLPIPNEIIFLDMPIELGNKISKNRKNKINNSDNQDIHESNYDFMKKSYISAKLISDRDFGIKTIECYKKNILGIKKVKKIDDINNEIMDYLIAKHTI